MTPKARSYRRKVWTFLGSVRTGIVLLIVLGLATLVGTIILQRPITAPAKMHSTYSPNLLWWLDKLGFTDVFHSWWFTAMLALLSMNIIVASLDRWPQVWRYFARPYLRPEPHFLASLNMHHEVLLRDAEAGIEAAEAAFRKAGLEPQRVVKETTSLYAEKNRFARLAPYAVHFSLLLIFAGGIIDGLYGWKGFVSLTEGETLNSIERPDGTRRPLEFALRCDAAGQENYPDGSPKRWWSKLAVLENGREVQRKEIEVNEPLVYKGIRFFQASFGQTGDVTAVKVHMHPTKGSEEGARILELRPGQPVELDANSTVTLAQFIPDFVVVDNKVEARSNQMNNPAVQLAFRTPGGQSMMWLFPRFPEFSHGNPTMYDFHVNEIVQSNFTGLQVSYEPGQYLVWAGVILMGVALAMTFYFVHIRFWAVPVDDGRGRLVLWVGASASKNRDEVEERFGKLVQEIDSKLATQAAASQEPAELAVR